MARAKFDINDIKTVHLNLLDSQVDLILNALMFYQYNLEYIANMFSESDKKRINELSKVVYTYEQIKMCMAEQLYSDDKKINRISAKEINNIEIDSTLNIKLNSTEEKILNLINREKYITQSELSKLLGFSEKILK